MPTRLRPVRARHPRPPPPRTAHIKDTQRTNIPNIPNYHSHGHSPRGTAWLPFWVLWQGAPSRTVVGWFTGEQPAPVDPVREALQRPDSGMTAW